MERDVCVFCDGCMCFVCLTHLDEKRRHDDERRYVVAVALVELVHTTNTGERHIINNNKKNEIKIVYA